MSANKEKISIAIVDDHPIVMEGLQKVLMEAYQYVSTICFTSGQEFYRFLQANGSSIDIVLLDINLPGVNGIELCKQVKSSSPKTCVLAFSNHSERNTIMRMLHAGASGYLLKNSSAQEVVHCINEAIGGELAICKEARDIIARPSLQDLKTVPVLTKREKEILWLIAEGKTSADIAAELFLSPLTIETHRRNMMQKFKANNIAALVKAAIENDLLK